MCRLAAPGDPVTLDTEGAEHDTEREVQRLEHRSLLDVQLEIGGSALELPAGVGRAVEVDPERADGVRQADAVPVDQLCELVLVAHRTCRR